jgi:hypothetical protein
VRRWLAAALCVALMAPQPAIAGQPQPLTFYGATWSLNDPVEQESPNFFYCGGSLGPLWCDFDPSTWVTNPTGCAWDVDDILVRRGYGDLASGDTASDSICLIADSHINFGGDPHIIDVWLVAPMDSLEVTVTNTAGVTWVLTPVERKHDYLYGACFYDTVAQRDQTYPVVPDSNGGTGTRVDYRLTVTNPGRTVRSVTAYEEVRGTTPPGSSAVPCPDDSYWQR